MESAHFWNCVGRCSQLHSDEDCEECVVDMHILPIKGTAQVTFKVVAGTEPTLSMPMLVANGHRLVYHLIHLMMRYQSRTVPQQKWQHLVVQSQTS